MNTLPLTASNVFHQNNGDVTKEYYRLLSERGPLGRIAVALFRAQKRSSRAKQYRRGKWRRAAYDVKSWSMSELCRELEQHGAEFGIRFGWKPDPNVPFGGAPSWVLYVEIPFIEISPSQMSSAALESGAAQELVRRQVSFHSPNRMGGPDYCGTWDGEHKSAERIIAFCDSVMTTLP